MELDKPDLPKDNYFLDSNPSELIPIVAASNPIENRTIVPAGVMSNMYEIKIPVRTENTEKLIEIIAVCLKPLPDIIAVTFGMTNNAEISSTPTS